MRRLPMFIISIFALLLATLSANAARCSHYLHDACEADGYSIVETERNMRGRHNCMAVVHDYDCLANPCEDYCGGKVTRKSKKIARATAAIAPVK